ncbi:transporter substrate-binding domain-containing protein [Pseudoduganella sp. FT25W]|uniref:Transporter substrate-binding domain-containing protein n=1 Tax=Duganella alba TaxID=2666081 RepID=A0A6L5QQX3_9BURK|nr:transporter substrate-binding domain-containing protein [Duganella alba]MRX11261.1 transporter substrate-binding domain-containing protein [Duganella alba]MRX19133.1 transporter substrate-binding domain-containing protein [Duganella alba]
MPSRSRLFFLPLPMLCAAALAGPGELVMLAPVDQAMPIARFQNGAIAGGIVKDFGDVLAQRLGRRPVYLNADVPEVTPALTGGRADAMCYVMPFWIDGDYNWSPPLFPDAEMIAARSDAPRLRSLKDLRDRQVGTVLGYRYQRVELVLGARFKRTDAPSMEANIQQMVAGKVPYTMISEATLNYQHRINPGMKVRGDLVFSAYKAQCAFSQKSAIPFDEVSRTIDTLIKDGSIDQILARYR